MKEDSSAENARFDEFACNYDSALEEGLLVSGEGKDYFCQGRIVWLNNCLRELNHHPKTVLDFGCGTGSASRYFVDLIQAESVTGVDSSPRSIDIAQRNYASEIRMQFSQMKRFEPKEQIDLAFCNGVFHHIPLKERAKAVDFIRRSVRRGGLFAFWENNPWNPGTRYIMRRIPFDRDAITLSVFKAERLLRSGGFEVLRIDFLFVFPRVLKCFRVWERLLSKLPLGAQYQILCRKP